MAQTPSSRKRAPRKKAVASAPPEAADGESIVEPSRIALPSSGLAADILALAASGALEPAVGSGAVPLVERRTAVPDPETAAPVRFLPEYDNIALSHSDRGRIIDPRTVGRITGYVGTFLVDGLIAGQWRLDRTKERHLLLVDPFVPLSDDQAADLTDEGERLLAWAGGDVAGVERRLEFGFARDPNRSAYR